MFARQKLTSLTLFLGLGIGAFAPAALAKTYKIDPVHSQVIFRIGHLQVSGVYGRFNDFTGTFELDAGGDLKSAVAKVGAKSIDTHVEARDDDVRENYIFAERFPSIDFQAKKIETVRPNVYRLTGDLTLHGVTRPLTVTATKTGEGTGMRGEKRVGADVKFSIKRSDFGLNYGLPGVGDDVELMVNIEGIQQ